MMIITRLFHSYVTQLHRFLAERDEKDLKDRPLKGPGGREFKGLKDIFTDDTKSKCIPYNYGSIYKTKDFHGLLFVNC